jgi:AraC-like DNA-binding protein
MRLSAQAMSLSLVAARRSDPKRLRSALPSLFVTLEASVVQVSVAGRDIALDRTACVVVPALGRVEVRGSASSPSSRVAVLGFTESLVARAGRTYGRLGFDAARLAHWLTRLEVLPRTVWIHEIVHRYVYERHALGEDDNETTRFLETEITKEIYFLFRDRHAGFDRASPMQSYGTVVARAMAAIEACLFEPLGVAKLASRAGASESTLLRAFRRELGCTPAEYWRTRKLDEALVLLRAGGKSVADVGSIVGYENPTAFGYAFKGRFGRPPSAFLPARPVRRAPP